MTLNLDPNITNIEEQFSLREAEER